MEIDYGFPSVRHKPGGAEDPGLTTLVGFDKKSAVRDHCLARKGIDPTPDDAATLFAAVPLSFEAVDVANALAAHARVTGVAAVAAVNAASFGARALVASAFARGLDDGGKRVLVAGVPGLSPRDVGLPA